MQAVIKKKPTLNLKKTKITTLDEMGCVLSRLYPEVFPKDGEQIKPLAIKIHHQILNDPRFQQKQKSVTNLQLFLSLFLQNYTQSPVYCRAILTQKVRYGIQGDPTPIKPSHLRDAEQRIKGKRPYRYKPPTGRFIPQPKKITISAKKQKQGIELDYLPKRPKKNYRKWCVFWVKVGKFKFRIELKPKHFKMAQQLLVQQKTLVLLGKLDYQKFILRPLEEYRYVVPQIIV